MEAEKIKIKTLIICLVAIFCVEGARWVVAPEHLHAPMIALGIARLLEIILILLVVLIWGSGLSSIGLSMSKFFKGLKKGLIWSAGFGAIAFFAFIVLSVAGIDALRLIETPLPSKQNDLLLFFLIGGVVGPVAEEIFFRGILYGFFRRWGVVVALVLSTALFVLPHLGQSWTPHHPGGWRNSLCYRI